MGKLVLRVKFAAFLSPATLDQNKLERLTLSKVSQPGFIFIDEFCFHTAHNITVNKNKKGGSDKHSSLLRRGVNDD